MRPLLAFLLIWGLSSPLLTAQRTTSADLERAATDITVSPAGGKISLGKRIRVSFPAAMIPLEEIGIPGREAPFEFQPALEGQTTWRSTTEISFEVTGGVTPGEKYKLALHSKLQDIRGEPIMTSRWTPPEFHAAPLTINSRFVSQGSALSATPTVYLWANYPVKPAELVRTIYFHDRASRNRYPAAVTLPSTWTSSAEEAVEAPSEVTRFSVSPAQPLPIGGDFDLIVDGLRDASTGTPMPALKVVSLGSTQAVEITGVRTQSHPLDQPTVILATTGPIDNETLTTSLVTVEPPVPGLTFFASNSALRMKGDFDTGRTYRVKLGSSVQSKTGYPLANPGPHEAVFNGLSPVVMFPQPQFYQRSALGLHVTILQANCPELTWRLSSVPLEKLHVVSKRLKEFERDARDPFTGRAIGSFQTELLTDVLALEVTAEGSLPAAASNEARYREIRWKPAAGVLPEGAYLLEAAASLDDGRIVGNRSLLFFNEVVIHRKFTPAELTIKTFTMETGEPVPHAAVEIIDNENVLRAGGISDAKGSLTLPRRPMEQPPRKPDPSYIVVKSQRGGGIQPYRGARFYTSGWARGWPREINENRRQIVASAFADRNLYRPGDAVHIKGTARARETDLPSGATRLSIPAGMASWSVVQGYDGPSLASGNVALDEFGGFEASWTPPLAAKLGTYRFRYKVPHAQPWRSVYFQIEEYKPPLFHVTLEPLKTAEGRPQMRIASHYFHGAPNSGALVRWEASWSPYSESEDGFEESDYSSPSHRRSLPGLLREAELRLDADGVGVVNLVVPFEKPLTCARYRADFSVSVLSPEGKVIEVSRQVDVTPHARYPSIKWTRLSADEPESKDLLVHLRVTDAEGSHETGVPMALRIYRREMQTVKERLGPGVYRHRNSPLYHTIESVETESGSTYRFTPQETGYYIAYAKLKNAPTAPAVSDEIHSIGYGSGRYRVHDDGRITLQLDKERYIAGRDTATIALEAPFGGQAWVCVETDRIIDQFLTHLPANNYPIKLPIKPAYHPNVHVSIYLLQPGGKDRLPMERFGTVTIEVDRPELKLSVTPELTHSEVEPGEEVTATVSVLCQGQPVLNSEVTVFAVDEAVHRLGRWKMPDWFAEIYPPRSLEVAAYRGLDEHFTSFEESEVTEKGFLIGGGGSAFGSLEAPFGFGPSSIRQDFRALALWKTGLRTDAQGKVVVKFKAPDNLTSYHLVAVAQTKSHQFGQGETSFKVAKRLMAEAALPRFVRRGDLLELRAVLRQNYVDNAAVLVRCAVEGDIDWLVEEPVTHLGLTKGLPRVVRFPCRVLGGDAVKVRFEAYAEENPSFADAVEVSLPVALPGITQRTGHFGVIPPSETEFPLHEKLPDHWRDAEGSYQMTVSHTPYLPELNSLPEVLDYPHGCLEQKVTRYLTYALMADLLDYLPELRNRHSNYRERLQEGMEIYGDAMLRSGFLPYWMGQRRPNHWVTLMAYWLVNSVKAQGIHVPQHLEAGLTRAHDILAHGKGRWRGVHLTTRALALFTHAETGHNIDGMEALLADLYARRGELGNDGLTFLTLAMNGYGVMEVEQRQLGNVLAHEAGERETAFDPVTFGSPRRGRTLRWLTRVRLASDSDRLQLSDAFLKQSEEEGNVTLSTQECFWRALLLAELVRQEKDATFTGKAIEPAPDYVSGNGISIAWKTQPLDRLRNLALKLGPAKDPLYYNISAEVLRESQSTETLEDRGFRLERVVTNLTAAERLGTEGAPFRIGDELLLTYRFQAKKFQHYVALTDELPAGIEAVNFNLPQLATMYQLPSGVRSDLYPDHTEIRDQSANLYFDSVPPGNHTYAILARVTAAGDFSWPPTQIVPMYQPYFGGLTVGRIAHSRHGP